MKKQAAAPKAAIAPATTNAVVNDPVELTRYPVTMGADTAPILPKKFCIELSAPTPEPRAKSMGRALTEPVVMRRQQTQRVISATDNHACWATAAKLTNSVAAINPVPMMLFRERVVLTPRLMRWSPSQPPARVARIPAQNGSAETIPDLSKVILRSSTRYPGSQLTKTPSAYRYPI